MSSADRPSVQRVKQLFHSLDTAPDEVLDEIRKKLIPYKRRQINAQQSRLLRLPDHIRISIIKLALPDGDLEFVGSDLEFVPARHKFPNLLGICHLIRDEAAKVFYTHKTIWFSTRTEEKSLAAFSKLDASHTSYIEKLRADCEFEWGYDAVEVARSLDKRSGMAGGTWYVSLLDRDEWINAVGDKDW